MMLMDIWFFINGHFVAIVVIGTVLGLVTTFAGARELMRAWANLRLWPRIGSVALLCCAVASLILLCVAGIGPYLVGAVEASRQESRLENLQHRLSHAETELRNAKAAENLKAGDYLSQIDSLKATIAALKAEIAAEQGEVHASLKQSNARVKAVQKDNASLKRQAAPRSLTQSQSDNLAAVAKNLAVHKVVLESAFGNSEAANFAIQLGKVLEAAGWQIVSFNRNVFESGEDAPVALYGPPQERSDRETLASELRRLGNVVDIVDNPQLPLGQITLFVGTKGS